MAHKTAFLLDNGLMSSAVPRNLAFQTPGFSRRGLAFIALLAILIQSIILQTHIHVAPQTPVPTLSTQQALQDKAPADQGPTTCQICAAIAQAGDFLTSASPFLAVAQNWVALVHRASETPAKPGTGSQGWQSRAPPRP